MYNHNYTIENNFKIFNQMVTPEIETLEERYKNNPEKFNAFCEKMRDFNMELNVAVCMQNKDSFDEATEKIRKYLRKEVKKT